ncbi:ribonuclease P [Caldiplasma sukawensis]
MRKDNYTQKIARNRIQYLYSIVENGNSKVERKNAIILIERIARRMDITLPSKIKRSYCKKCKNPIGTLTRVRIKNGYVNVKCNLCGNVKRYRISR